MTNPGPDRRSPLENRIPPPILVPFVGLAMWAAARLGPALAVPRLWMIAAAWPIGIIGLVTGGSGIFAFRKAKTTIDPVRIDQASSLVERGIYRYTRNPMYVGLTCLLLVWALYLGTAWAVLGPVLFVAFITRFQIIPEERAMSARFGRAYDEYRKKVRRWL